MDKIRIAIAGVGNCASALLQGIEYYRQNGREDAIGFMHWDIGGYTPGDIEVVSAFDIDQRKVGKDVAEAIFQLPNCTKEIYGDVPTKGASYIHPLPIL
jgi:myo-inositol-1-phosphate synthase